MAASAEEKISAALNGELENLEKECMRPLQRQAFLCSARCCEDQTGSQASLQACLESCMRPVLEAEQNLKSEIEHFQDRLTRCAKQCDDDCRDMLPASPSPKDMGRARSHAESCLMKCADQNIDRIPQMIDKYRKSLGNKF